MDEIEIPNYFICPISLQIMKDPVTTITGITYDRNSIAQWLFTNNNTTCPVTRKPLPKDSLNLTPNHTLLRLIQSWCTQNGIHRIPTPQPPLDTFQVLKLLKDLNNPNLQLSKIKELKLLASQERNKNCLLQAGVPKAMILFILSCFRIGQIDKSLEEALSLLQFVNVPQEEIKILLEENEQILDSLTWILGCDEMENPITVKADAVIVLNAFIDKASSNVMQSLKRDLFENIVKNLRCGTTKQGMKAALHVMLSACNWGRNTIMMVESGAVFEVIEIELEEHEMRLTELNMEILLHLCSYANGRAQFLSHKGAIALLTERIFAVSRAVDYRAISILSLVTMLSATRVVIQEMVEVGTVSKLCRVLQSDHHGMCVKDKARELLKSHAGVWKYSPCISYRDRSFYAEVE